MIRPRGDRCKPGNHDLSRTRSCSLGDVRRSWQRASPNMSHSSSRSSRPPRKPTAYWDYIKLEEILSLQGGLAPDDSDLANDEVMFITVHQIDELWFKLILRELVSVRNLFAKAPVPEQALASAVRGLRR